jgi:PqqD family protein of HPr-rel-A system
VILMSNPDDEVTDGGIRPDLLAPSSESTDGSEGTTQPSHGRELGIKLNEVLEDRHALPPDEASMTEEIGDPAGETGLDGTLGLVEATCYVRRDDVRVQELDGEVLLYDGEAGDTHHLNATAALIWRACDGQTSPQEMAERLTDAYEVKPPAALAHVERLLEELRSFHLILPSC